MVHTKYPHLYLEIKDMLLQFLSESSDDIERLGRWKNCAYYCSNYREPFFWEKESINKEMNELLKEEDLEEGSDKIYYNEF